MKQARVIVSPNNFLVAEYSSGSTIGLQRPADMADIERLRRSFDAGQFSCSKSEREVTLEVGRALVNLGVIEEEEDFSESLFAYTGERRLGPQLTICLRGHIVS